MPTTPSPYGYNHARYKKVPKRVKSGTSGCAVTAVIMITTPIVGLITAITRIV